MHSGTRLIRTPRGYAIVSALSGALRKNVTDKIFIDVKIPRSNDGNQKTLLNDHSIRAKHRKINRPMKNPETSKALRQYIMRSKNCNYYQTRHDISPLFLSNKSY